MIHRLITCEHLRSLDVTALTVHEPYLDSKIALRSFKGNKDKRPKRD